MRELKHVICCYGSTRPIRRNPMDEPSKHFTMPQPPNGIPGYPIRGYESFPHPVSREYIPANYGLGREMIGAEGPEHGRVDGGYL